jgi:diguanylate cyclase (GGDEF)-like protein/PAS domain S-box-containing protein
VIRLGWKRFITISVLSLAISTPLGEAAVSAVFLIIGLAAIRALLQAPQHYNAPYRHIWSTFAIAILLFLLGGVADVFTSTPPEGTAAPYPGWREPFDLAAYVALLIGCGRMAQARQANRDRTNTLDALIGMGGIGALAWATVLTEYLASTDLSSSGKAVGVMFTLVSLALGFSIARVAIGPGARPPSYYFLAVATAGAFASELFIELELTGRLAVPGSEMLSSLTSAIAIIAITAGVLHPSMAALTQAPEEATPNMTRRRLVAMTVAVLIPPALLLAGESRATQVETVAIIGVWAALSVMVMVRIFSLAKTRERLSEMDRAVAAADSALASAANHVDMAHAVVGAATRIVSHLDGIAIHAWTGHEWDLLAAAGESAPNVPNGEPRHPGTSFQVRDPGVRHSIHFRAADILNATVTVDAGVPVDELELVRIASLAADFSQAVESAAMREELGRERSERRFRALVENSADIIMVLDENHEMQFISPAGPRLLGFNEETLIGQKLDSLVNRPHQDTTNQLVINANGRMAEVQMTCRDGSHRWFEMSVANMISESEIQGFVVTASEISAQKQAQLELRRSEARFRSLVQHDADGIISWISPSASTVLGVEPATATEHPFISFAHPQDRDDFAALVARMAMTDSLPQSSELRVKHTTEGFKTLEVTITNLLADPSLEGIVVNAHDVTERKRLEYSLRHQALHDDLTGIPNRVLFRDRMEQALARRDDALAVLVIDLDDFKTVNDGLGHSTGDELLKVLSFRLQQFLRAGDTAARLGGDEFAVLLAGDLERSEVMAISQRLLRSIEEPVEVQGREIVLHASIGVAYAADMENATPDTLLRSADLAMYGAKNRGKSRITVFDESMHEGAFERLELKADLAHALDRGELTLHYQPVVELATGAISGFEALMRWQHSERGMVGPATFIPLAEETGLIVSIGRWLVIEALGQLKHWQALYPNRPPMTMSINLSGRQLEDDAIVHDIAQAVSESGVDPATVIMELTESILVEDNPTIVARLHDIRSLGLGLYADDFGAGFASYSALQSLPFTGVKIDRSLVSGLEGQPSELASAQVRSIIEMAARTDLEVVAEGIESGSQAAALRDMACGKAQGYYFARPADPTTIEAELAARDILTPVAKRGA